MLANYPEIESAADEFCSYTADRDFQTILHSDIFFDHEKMAHALLSGRKTWSATKKCRRGAELMMQLGLARHLDKVLHSATQN